MRLNFSTQRSREAGKCCQAETAFLPPQLFKSIQSWMTHQVAQHIRFLSLKHTPSNERLATSVCTTVKNRVSNATAWISPFEVSTTHSNFAPKNLAASTVLKPTRFPLVVGYPVVYLYACVCVSLKTLVHTGAAKFAASLSDAFLPEQEQRDETREKRKRVKGRDAEVVSLRHVFWNCLAWVDELLWRNTGTRYAGGAEIFVRVYRYPRDPISRGLIIKYELTAYHELLYNIKSYLWLARVHDR